MLKVALASLVAMPLTFASAEAFDSFGPENAGAAFGAYGLQGLGVAGQFRAEDGVRLFRPIRRSAQRRRARLPRRFAGPDMCRSPTETPW